MFADEFKDCEKDFFKDVCDIVIETKPMSIIKLDDDVLKACRNNNTQVCKNPDPIEGGNKEELQTILEAASKQMPPVREFSIFNWQHTAIDLVAYQILKHFKSLQQEQGSSEVEGRGSVLSRLSQIDEYRSPLLDTRVKAFGISYRGGHPTKDNAIQIAYTLQEAVALE